MSSPTAMALRIAVAIAVAALAVDGGAPAAAPARPAPPVSAKMPALVAHRGASDAAPENTVAAFRAAWQENADAIESDWRLTRDGRIVGLHDATVDRTTDGHGGVAELAFDDVRRLDAGGWKDKKWRGEKIPTLREMLAVVPAGKRTFIEVRVGPEIIDALKKEIQAAKVPLDRLAVIAFDEKVIAAAKAALPQVKAYWLYSFKRKDGRWSMSHDELVARLKSMRADGADLGFTRETAEVVNGDLAAKLRAARLELLVWTIDEPELAVQARDLGVTAITTNRPAALRAALAPGR